MNNPNIAVLGDGGWGTTLAILLSNKGYKVSLWGAFSDYTSYLQKKRINTKFLPCVKIPKEIEITADLKNVLINKDVIVLAIPSKYIRAVLKKIKRYGFSKKTIYLSVIKGIEISSGKTMSEVIKEELGGIKLAALSGPTIALEVAKGMPAAVVVASVNFKVRKYLQNIFMTESFRVYTKDDLIGVELGGSLKNIIAIACGISDGLGFGTNTKAALLARGLAEISRLGHSLGAKVSTFSGISGLGDLVTTCISKHSRNRFVGEQIGKGISLKNIISNMQLGVAEGITTAKSAYQLSLKYKVDMPIIKEVYSVIYNNKSPLKALKDLMDREGKEE
ncbi:MAG: NAD(P)H-dependent glycerol-3-phosphate dehydrogenase [Candidatus Omnitrophota bacterium]